LQDVLRRLSRFLRLPAGQFRGSLGRRDLCLKFKDAVLCPPCPFLDQKTLSLQVLDRALLLRDLGLYCLEAIPERIGAGLLCFPCLLCSLNRVAVLLELRLHTRKTIMQRICPGSLVLPPLLSPVCPVTLAICASIRGAPVGIGHVGASHSVICTPVRSVGAASLIG
jgi:hypothetical protein